MFADVINRVPIFAGNDMGFITQLLMSFKMEIAGPGDYIIREGTHGRCMYILHRGRVEVQPHLPCGWMPPRLHGCNTAQRSALQRRTTCCNTVLHAHLLTHTAACSTSAHFIFDASAHLRPWCVDPNPICCMDQSVVGLE